jgi:hypothetical protein
MSTSSTGISNNTKPPHNRTPGTSDICKYVGCKRPGVGELRANHILGNNGIPWTMCDDHILPEEHPTDIHDRLVRWIDVAQ